MYDVFGAVRAQSGATTEWSYTGEQHDPTGLEYLRARYYDASTGRFVSRDPLPLLQRYAYAGNNPAVFVDPTGLCCKVFKKIQHAASSVASAVGDAVAGAASAANDVASGTVDALTAIGDAERAVGGAVVDKVVNNITDPKLLAKDAQVIAGVAFVGCLVTPGADFVCAGAAAVTYGVAVAHQYYLADSTHERVFLIASLGLEAHFPGIAGQILSDLADTLSEPQVAEAPGLLPPVAPKE